MIPRGSLVLLCLPLSLLACTAPDALAVCAVSEWPCTANVTRAFDPQAYPAASDDDDDDVAETSHCLLVNCSHRAAALQGQVPCDLPPQTTWLLLSDAGFGGALSFPGLLGALAATNLMCAKGNQSCASAWPGLVDLSNNEISGLAGANETFWQATVMNAFLDLSFNQLTELPDLSFKGSTLAGLSLANNSIQTIGSTAFRNAEIYGNVELSNNGVQLVKSRAFQDATIQGGLALNNNAISKLGCKAFFGASIGAGLDLQHNRLPSASVLPGSHCDDMKGPFAHASIQGSLLLQHNLITLIDSLSFFNTAVWADVLFAGNEIAVIAPNAFLATTVGGTLDLSHQALAALGHNAFSNLTASTLNLSDNAITAIAGGAYASTGASTAQVGGGAFSITYLASLDLSGNQLTALDASTFADLNIYSTASFADNPGLSLLNNSWFNPFPLEMSINMSGNPSQCSVQLQPDHSSTFVCTCDPRNSSILGNGAWCSVTPCAPYGTSAVDKAIANGRVVCRAAIGPSWDGQQLPSGTDCVVVCDDGYQALNSSATAVTCLGGVWGQRPNHAGVLPVCTKTPGYDLEALVGAALGSFVAALVVVAIGHLLWRYRRQIRRQEYVLELKERLLTEKTEELDQLQRVFTISAAEVVLESPLASGAFGDVWRGRWNDMTVAVKRLRPTLLAMDESSVQEFEAESALMRTLRHPNIVTFFGAGSDVDGVPFLVVEYMNGSLRGILTQPPPPPSAAQVSFATDAARGMAYLHSRGLIHRDLKSGNLLGNHVRSRRRRK